MTRRTTALCLSVAAAVACACGAYAYHHHHRYKHLAVHDPGVVYRSAWLEPDALAEVIEQHDIRAVVNLCAPGETGEPRWAAERATVAGCGATLIEVEMPLSVDPADPAIERHLAVLADPGNYPMLVHCRHGVTRTAKLLAMYDIALGGRTAEQTLAAQPTFGRDEHNAHVTAFVREFERSHKTLYPRVTAAAPPAPGTGTF